MQPLKDAIARKVVGMFNDRQRGERPVVRSTDALFPPDAVIRRVHGDVTSMLVGGIAALLLQMLHPGALAGVWDHSNFRKDMAGRLRRTARFIATTTYADRAAAEAAIARVQTIHGKVAGTLPDGTPYSATDPHLLAWVHVTEATSFLRSYIRYVEPGMSRTDQDRYYAEFAVVAERLGADPVPHNRAEAEALIARIRPELVADERAKTVAKFLLGQAPSSLTLAPFQMMALEAGVDLLPDWARRMHGFNAAPLQRPLVRAGTFGMARTLRWAFAK